MVKGKEDYVCQLLKSLYGLKQAPYEWNEEFNKFILVFGIVRSEADPCIYFRHVGDEIPIVIIYFDDSVIASNKPDIIKAMIEHLKKKYRNPHTETNKIRWNKYCSRSSQSHHVHRPRI